MHIKMSVNQYDLDGNYIRTFDSVYRAEKTCGKYNRTIHHCLHGDIKSALGYLWRYEQDYPAGEKIDPIYRRTPRGKAVVKYSTAGKYISRYDSIKDVVIQFLYDGFSTYKGLLRTKRTIRLWIYLEI